METLEQRIRRVTQEDVAIVPYDARWPERFRREKEHLLSCLPNDLIRRIEHFGSTAVPGLAAKPVVDMLVEVSDLGATRTCIAPVLVAQGYDYFWRPTRAGTTARPSTPGSSSVTRAQASAPTTFTWSRRVSWNTGTGCSFGTT